VGIRPQLNEPGYKKFDFCKFARANYYCMKKVLLINDDKDFQYLMTSYLERRGFKAQSVDTTDAVVPLIQEFAPEVIIIDMKIVEDKRVCDEIREKTKTPAKIVLLTDKAVPLTAVHECKPDIVIQKPFPPEELIEKIAK
jgi:DNA-binding response OmpR family regulator